MKKSIYTTFTILSFSLIGCAPASRYITEKFIKTNIENHISGETSTIRIYSLFKYYNITEGNYIEFTGYKYKSTKGLVIGADKYYAARQKFPGDKTIFADVTYINLDTVECQSILDNYKILTDRVEKEKPKVGEEIYHDYTVNKDLFISFRKDYYTFGIMNIYIWINGEKYTLLTDDLIGNLKKFMKY